MADLDATVGGEDANSYVTVAEANDYFASRLNSGAWDDAAEASPAEQEPALISATWRLNQEGYRGERADSDQPLAWPRTGARDADGNLIDSETVPDSVKRAQMELALAMLEDDLLADTGLEGFSEVKVGPVAITTREGRTVPLPANVRREIRHVLDSSPMQFRMERA